MKVIDLLNKIANKEEVPEKIKYQDDIWLYDEPMEDYYYENEENGDMFWLTKTFDYLNDEIEIIEEKKIEKIKWELTKETINTVSDSNTIKITALMKRTEKLKNTLNEIIDYINEANK